jgi:hypothetical protein
MHPLVDAFWQGRGKLKKTKNKYFDNDKKPKAACAIGAIYYGLYKMTSDMPVIKISQDYPDIHKWVPVPCGHDSEGGTISAILIHLNDGHDAHTFSDQKIAEWLEGALNGPMQVPHEAV